MIYINQTYAKYIPGRSREVQRPQWQLEQVKLIVFLKEANYSKKSVKRVAKL